MATTVTHNFTVGDTVFVVNPETGIREALVSAVTINIKPTGTTITYNIAFKKTNYGTSIVSETGLYGDIDEALLAYKTIVDVP